MTPEVKQARMIFINNLCEQAYIRDDARIEGVVTELSKIIINLEERIETLEYSNKKLIQDLMPLIRGDGEYDYEKG